MLQRYIQAGGVGLSNLISKKELLERYKISYGTLYRWKRMGLIPDDWLVKRSTFTGQETFFDEAQICERVEAIIAKKDSMPLEEIASELLQKNKSEPKLTVETKYWTKEVSLSDVISVKVMFNGKETVIKLPKEEDYNE